MIEMDEILTDRYDKALQNNIQKSDLTTGESNLKLTNHHKNTLKLHKCCKMPQRI